ncbi:hypothetical protein KAT95_02760 [Candidatus Parcubacteria bacterium]|nr:hypothetical protein [Candidatus Parcubacteria bacterium]
MNSKTKIFIGILIMVIVLVGGLWIWNSQQLDQVEEWKEFEADKNISKTDAYNLVISELLNGSTEGKWVYVGPKPVKAGTTIESWHSSIELPQKEGWFFFVDDAPWANWAHPCRYVFVDFTGKITVHEATTPPNNIMELEKMK